ncbi:hypothetical protein LY78DRAFT_89152 [Colletotrichum sublineola]|nr:hypothetical protein LY78DRAFT_89152 [Colletotrichum sublineola]
MRHVVDTFPIVVEETCREEQQCVTFWRFSSHRSSSPPGPSWQPTLTTSTMMDVWMNDLHLSHKLTCSTSISLEMRHILVAPALVGDRPLCNAPPLFDGPRTRINTPLRLTSSPHDVGSVRHVLVIAAPKRSSQGCAPSPPSVICFSRPTHVCQV